MSLVIYFFGSGLAFFVGVGLVLLAVLLATLRRWPALQRLSRLLAIIGVIFVAFSAAALPYWFYATAAVATFVWLVLERRWNHTSRFRLAVVRLMVALVWLAGGLIEGQYQIPPTIAAQGLPALWIIGDSLTAGEGNPKTETWPRILARTHGIVVHDHSQAGATVGSALRNLEWQPLGDGIVLLEIGGNDLLGSTPAVDFEDKLERLLSKVCQPGIIVLMFELPLPPFCNQYGIVQRRLAARYGVTLISKRLFVEVLTARGATTDGVHLSQQGHVAMAKMVWSLVGPVDAE
jgi:acyl-CoA thioesterase I